ncbi:MAG: anthranilate synthase component I, partial [Pseudomonadota bacterium]
MTQAEFQALAEQGYNRVAVVREVLADTETPLSTYLKLGRGKFSYFFESVQGGEKWGRFSIIGLPCHTVIRVSGKTVTVETDGNIVEEAHSDDPFEFVNAFQARFKVAPAPETTRFTGGLVGYFGYDTVRYVETSIGPAGGTDE